MKGLLFLNPFDNRHNPLFWKVTLWDLLPKSQHSSECDYVFWPLDTSCETHQWNLKICYTDRTMSFNAFFKTHSISCWQILLKQSYRSSNTVKVFLFSLKRFSVRTSTFFGIKSEELFLQKGNRLHVCLENTTVSLGKKNAVLFFASLINYTLLET